MLTLKDLKESLALNKDRVIATGVALDNELGINMTGSGRELRWVAVRGHGYFDWAIYCHYAEYDIDYIMAHGDKVTNKETIRRLVPCTDGAFEFYRY